jgi:hypothetical protein
MEIQAKVQRELEAAQHQLEAREREHEMEVGFKHWQMSSYSHTVVCQINVLDSKSRAQEDSFVQLQVRTYLIIMAVDVATVPLELKFTVHTA